MDEVGISQGIDGLMEEPDGVGDGLVDRAVPGRGDVPGECCAAVSRPREPVHWRADYCMQKMETDDEIAVSACMEEEGKLRFPGSCAASTHYKKMMCEQAIRSGTRAGTLDACVQDQGFMGRTVRNGGVGG